MYRVSKSDRIHRAQVALSAYKNNPNVSDDADAALRDLMTDLLHLAHSAGLDAEEYLGVSLMHFEAEEKHDEFDSTSESEDDEPDLSSYSAWLEDTGEDDSFEGDQENGIPGTAEKYEQDCLKAGVVPDWE